MNTRDFFNSVLIKVKEVSIEGLFIAYGLRYEVSNKAYYYTDCPLHNGDIEDKNSTIHIRHNKFRCYSCQDRALSPINLIMEMYNFKFIDAVMDIALKTDIIKQYEHDNYYAALNKNIPLPSDVKVNALSQKVKKQAVPVKTIASEDTLNKVYNVFMKGCSLAGGSKLNNEHLNYLKDRGLNDEDIKHGNYFTIPPQAIMNNLAQELKKEYNLDENVLENVPGFYKDKNQKYTFKYNNAIGIPIFNAKGFCGGIQIRLNKEIVYTKKNGKEVKIRYIWFSSDEVPEGCSLGVGPGTPVGVIYPKTEESTWSKNIFITEGYFKAQQLSKFTNAIVIYVQGVGNWRDSIDEIKYITSKYTSIKRLFICYDADIAYKPQVNNHASNMSSALTEEFPDMELFYCLWNPDDGKGIDDLIFNNKTNTIKLVKKAIYDNLYKMVIKNTRDLGFDFDKLDDRIKLQIFMECIYNRAKK